MAILVVVIWYKVTPLDTTIYREALYNNKDGSYGVVGSVVSFML